MDFYLYMLQYLLYRKWDGLVSQVYLKAVLDILKKNQIHKKTFLKTPLSYFKKRTIALTLGGYHGDSLILAMRGAEEHQF